jgi:hypothetical protein
VTLAVAAVTDLIAVSVSLNLSRRRFFNAAPLPRTPLLRSRFWSWTSCALFLQPSESGALPPDCPPARRNLESA